MKKKPKSKKRVESRRETRDELIAKIAPTMWKPGQSGNPNGRPPVPPELKKLRRLTRKKLIKLCNLIVMGNVQELKEIALGGDEDVKVIEALIAGQAVKGMGKHRDTKAVQFLLELILGPQPTKQQIEHTGIPTAPPAQVIITLPDNGRSKK